MKNIRKLALYLLVYHSIWIITSCATTAENGKASALAPQPLYLAGVPSSDDNYSQGYRDGCYNAFGNNGFGLIRLHNNYPRTSDDLYMNSMYRRGYKDGDRQCSVYVNNEVIL